MSNKTVASKEKKPLSTATKISLAALIIIGLDLGAIAAAVKIMEIRQNGTNPEYQALKDRIATQTQRLDKLEKLPLSVSTISQQTSANSNTINLISDNLNALKEEVGNNQMRTIYTRLDETGHRITTLEETQSPETLILSIALMIKENALYHRSFADEAAILSDIGQNVPQISADITTISQYKDKEVIDNTELAEIYQKIAKDFTFGIEIAPESKEETTISKGLNILKDSVSHIKLDRVIVLKKQKKTEEQIKLLNNLNSLVEGHKFTEALKYINENAEFSKIADPNFAKWQQDVQDSITFNQALTRIIQTQLTSLREDVKKGQVKQPKINKDIVETTDIDTAPINETSSDVESKDAEILE